MRRQTAWLLVILAGVQACSGSRGADAKSGVRLPTGGPDPIVIRIPRSGGFVRAYVYPTLDSIAWRSTEAVPELGSVLAFDAENGVIAFADAGNVPGWIDFRIGTVRQPEKGPLTLVSSTEGASIFGVASDRKLVRLTSGSGWSEEVRGRGRVRRLFPQPDGSLIVLTDMGGKKARLLHFKPPEPGASDSLALDLPQRGTGTPLGDRVYLAVGRELIGVPTSDFQSSTRVKAADEILAIAPTPSGDRIYLASKGEKAIEIVDRYSGSISGRVRLPGFVTELRMDQLGRYLLARPVDGDSAWVVAIATGELVGTLITSWRDDLPMVAPDGAVGVLLSTSVEFIDPVSGKSVVRAEGGAADFWYTTLWNGLRPRAKGLDRAVMFQSEESAQAVVRARTESLPPPPDTTTATPPPARPPNEPPPKEVEPPREPARDRGWTVSFAAVLSQERARDLARQITVDGMNARVSVSRTDGTTVYRVLMGPYPTRPDAERVGKASGHSYWIIEGIP